MFRPFFIVLLFIGLAACRQKSGYDLNELTQKGEFGQAEFVLSQKIGETRNDSLLQEKYILELETLRRIRKEFPFKQADVKKQFQKYYPNLTDEDLDKWEISGELEMKVIDGEKRYFSRAVGNFFRINPEAAFKENPWGIVTLSVCNMRAKSDHAAELLTQALFGTPVKIYRRKGDWYLVQTPDRYFGWVDGAGNSAKTNAEMLEWKKLPKVIYAEVSGFAYSEPKQNSGVKSDLVLGNLLSVESENKDCYKLLYPDGCEAFVKKNECVSTDQWNSKSFTVNDLLKTAFRFKGVPYLWGGTSPKMMDCSGFTKTTYYFNGVLLQRDASQQTLYGEEISVENGYENLQAGDLVFFGRESTEDRPERVTHVGLCIGDQKFIHESGKVRVNSLDATSEDYTEHYEKGYVRARRVLNSVDDNGIEWIVDNAFYKMVLPE